MTDIDLLFKDTDIKLSWELPVGSIVTRGSCTVICRHGVLTFRHFPFCSYVVHRLKE